MKKLIIPSKETVDIVNQQDIVFCKADNSYTLIFLVSKENFIISKSLATICKELDCKSFARISQSYLVNLSFIKRIDKKKKTIKLLNNEEIPFTVGLNAMLDHFTNHTVKS